MVLSFVKLSPTGNTTVLILDPVPRARHGAVSRALLSQDGVGGEQVGFVEKGADLRIRARLQMMGGEFCGNATMALGALCARADGLGRGEAGEYLFEVSGTDAPVRCRVEARDGLWRGRVEMPLPLAPETIDLAGARATAVAFPGITHLIFPEASALAEDEIRRLLPLWNRQIGAEALGAILFDEAACGIVPLVYVPGAGTVVRERGCGSGTAALGCALAARAQETFEGDVAQAGGRIRVRATWRDGGVRALSIEGDVRLCAEGAAWVWDS